MKSPSISDWCKIALLAITLSPPQISSAQTLALTVSNQIATVAWPASAIYYLLQTNADLLPTNLWGNVGSGSALSVLVPGGSGAVLTNNFTNGTFSFTQPMSNARQFYQLKAPTLIPVFGFAIFYNQLLEFSGSATMMLNGFIHANGDIEVGTVSSAAQTFNGTVTTTGTISSPANGGYTTNTLTGPVTFNAKPPLATNVPAFISPLGTNSLHGLIEIPPVTESVLSLLGQSRLYNLAQVVLVISNSPAGGAPSVRLYLQTSYNGLPPGSDLARVIRVLTNATDTFLRTNSTLSLPFLSLSNTFTDQREMRANLLVTQIDVNQYQSWLLTNSLAIGKFTGGNYPTVLFVADQRSSGTNNLSVVRLVNGVKLPNNNGLGFTVATPNPLYVLGSYNTTVNSNTYANTLGATTNGATVPAALIADAITILSPNWLDAASAASYTTRPAASMTVNAALLTGIVPSIGIAATNFSGGVHNLPRFLENWTGATFTLNTSLVCLFSSQMATNRFQFPGAYYSPPTRLWGFDQNFSSPNKLPPGTIFYTLP